MFEKENVKLFVQCHLFPHSPPGRYPNDKYPLNISNLSRKHISPAVLFASNGTSYTACSQICVYRVYTRILHNIETLFRQNKLKIETAVNAACQGNLSAPEVLFWSSFRPVKYSDLVTLTFQANKHPPLATSPHPVGPSASSPNSSTGQKRSNLL